ncbi:MAG TPA: tRNA uridine-5-carboxymethylaminomethyl(34) synthesis GTPase MnmE, partial [Vicinamibacterales bacterium]|nr:tRNA uridine-5-carboxymethylaminomethyl(34) synthesis GTPase MnmE [Vicinamibacterales bacterium]
EARRATLTTICERLSAPVGPLPPRSGSRPEGSVEAPADCSPASPAVAEAVNLPRAADAALPVHTSEAGAAQAIDQVVATYFPAPHSYTGEDVVELSAHGSPVVLRAIVRAALDAGGRLAEPGEFTLRAFLNGRIDLTQAEAVADLIAAVTPLQARAAFDQLQGTLTQTIGSIDAALFDLIARLEASVDFPDEGYHFVDPGALAGAIADLRASTTALLAASRRGRLVREGFQAAIVGRPNVGKSSLFNALAGASRAIVTAVAGTTRDLVTETVDVEGLRVTLVDTAGLREAGDAIEAEGVRRSHQAQRAADVVVVVVDRSAPLEEADRQIVASTTGRARVVVANKADREPAWTHDTLGAAAADAVDASATTGIGLDEVRERLVRALDVDVHQDRPEITNVRHVALVQRADEALARAGRAAFEDGASLSEEFVLADLQEARAALEEIAGRRVTDDLLAHIFSRFCIGK